ncbi:alginate export family protein [Rhizobium sullae]|uniref:Alginate export family protein n=1 Tax=Rhizobium sullae TaxID=50338 RepID=A0A2N0D1R3_RHISU|nr:alginate export family protein [Rhizobium sullae]PKA39998.1 alginate export family protein [Rhizobium sullae]
MIGHRCLPDISQAARPCTGAFRFAIDGHIGCRVRLRPIVPWAMGAAASLLIALATVSQADAQSVSQDEQPGNQATQETISPPPLTALRYTEDYSYLRDPSKRSGAWWEPYKYIPLDESGVSYLTFGAEVRFRTEAYWNFNWGEVPIDNYQWYRVMPYADLHLGPNVRLFGQIIGAWAAEKETSVTGVDETGVEILQGFADLDLPLGNGADLTLRAGRQLLSYGSERLISTRYGPNVLRSFDAGLASVDVDTWRIDAFYGRPVRNKVENFNDRADDNRSIWSLYATRTLEDIGSASGLDLYYIGYRNEETEFNQGAGAELRHTLGSRFFGESHGWDWNLEGMFQFGRFDDGNIHAWSIASDVGYTFEDATFSPRLGLKANIISGDRNSSNPNLQTFNALFPKGKYFGEIGLIGPANLINFQPSLTLQLNDQWTLSGAVEFYGRQSLSDGIYDNGGGLVRSSNSSRARFIGTQVDLVLGWEPVHGFSTELAYSVFAPGKFIKDTGPSKTVHFVGFETVMKF